MKVIIAIIKKEFIELFRDKSTIFLLLIPMIIFPVFSKGLYFISQESSPVIKIGVDGEQNNDYEIFIDYAEDNNYDIVLCKNNGVNLLKNGEVDCVLVFCKNSIDFLFNSASYVSLSSTTALFDNFQKFYYEESYASQNNLPRFELKEESGKNADMKTSISNLVIPIIFVYFIMQTPVRMANDQFAGECERNTIEMVLLTNVKRRNLYIGKSVALFLFSFSGNVLMFISLLISSDYKMTTYPLMCETKIDFIKTLIVLCFSVALLSVESVCLALSVSLVSKRTKNAQMLNDLIMAFPLLFLVLSISGIVKKQMLVCSYIPVVNNINVVINALKGNVLFSDVIIMTLTNIALLFLVFYCSNKYLNSERIVRC